MEKQTLDWNSDIWDDDLLKRKSYAQFLYNYLSERKGTVINLDSSWGTGKSFFLERFKKTIEKVHPCLYFNAWEADFSEDAFGSFFAELDQKLSEIESEKGVIKKTWNNIRRKSGAKLLVLTKIAGLAGLKMAVGERGIEELNNLISKEAEDSILGEIDKVSNRLIDNYLNAKKSIAAFRARFNEFVSSIPDSSTYELPVFVLIDELDRCRPSFAIELLEKIKHIFSVKNVVFIVATATDQLNESIKGYYGSGFQSAEYLRRFFDQSLSLPTPDARKFVEVEISKFTFAKRSGRSFLDINHRLILETIQLFQLKINCSFRDIQRITSRVPVLYGQYQSPQFNVYYLFKLFLEYGLPEEFDALEKLQISRIEAWEKMSKTFGLSDPENPILVFLEAVLKVDDGTPIDAIKSDYGSFLSLNDFQTISRLSHDKSILNRHDEILRCIKPSER